jgi:hypothetical protein
MAPQTEDVDVVVDGDGDGDVVAECLRVSCVRSV